MNPAASVPGPLILPAQLVLASSSPRRITLLRRLGLSFETLAADLDEPLYHRSQPEDQVLELAKAKAQMIWETTGGLVLAADTAVALDGRALGKPKNVTENRSFLEQLSGRWHSVFSGTALINPQGEITSFVDQTRVRFRALSTAEINWYAMSGEGLDKAGGYSIQDRGMVLIERIEGDFYTVMGLPVRWVWAALLREGLRVD